jgi:ABC-type antimicrobial peptide transport system permease subunit
MFKNYLKIAFRNLLKQKVYSLINISGLAVGIAVCILIFLWVQDELSYDRFHENADQLYRVVFEYEANGQILHHWRTPPPLAAGLIETYPEVINATKFHSHEGVLVSYEEKKFRQTGGFTDTAFFEIFANFFVKGDPQTVFANPNSVVISERMAAKFFGKADPVNKILRVDNQLDLTVTGVIRNWPGNSYLKFDFLTQFEHLERIAGYGNVEDWRDWGYNTFLLLSGEANISQLNQKITDYMKTIFPDTRLLYLQPLTHIHLYSLEGRGSITFVYIFSLIAVFILIIACVNFMNLTTARSIKRAKEVGLRKVIGASKLSLIRQFFGESILISFIALLLSIGLVELLLPAFNDLSGKTLSLDILAKTRMLPVLIGITLVTGVISGIYPALFLSSFKPVMVLKGSLKIGSSSLRNALVVFQFSLSILLIICTIIVSDQLNFIRNKRLGFEKNNVVYMPLNNSLVNQYESFKNELLEHPNILQVTATSSKVGISPKWSTDLQKWEGNHEERMIKIALISVDEDFAKTFNLEMASGRFYAKGFADENSMVLNEAAINAMGLEEPIGKRVWDESVIVGIVKNFNFRSLHREIGPLALLMVPDWHTQIAIKLKAHHIPQALQYIEEVSRKFSPEFPFEYSFLDQEFDEMYRSELRMEEIFYYFTSMAILISCLGLLALAAFAAEQRTKEIGIRKVLGASVSGVLFLLSKSFTRWVIWANVIAWPVAWYVMNQWLQNFAYRIDIGIWTFLLAGALALIIALLTVGYQAIKAAFSNPVEALRYE